MTRISHKKRAEMTYHMMEHLKGNKEHPPVTYGGYVDPKVSGAGILGSKLVTHTHTDHHNRKTVVEPVASTNEVVVDGPPGTVPLVLSDEDYPFYREIAEAAAKIHRERGNISTMRE